MPLNNREVIRQNFLARKWDAEMERMDEAQEKLDLYMDDYEEIIRDMMSKLFHPSNYERLYYHVNQSQNILKRVVKEISTIYKVAPQRPLRDESERYAEIVRQTKLNTKMKKVNRYTNLLNETIVKVGVRYGAIVYDIITPNNCMVLQNELDPTKADAIVYMITRKNTAGDDGIEYHFWDIEGDYYIFDKDFRIMEVIYDAVENPCPYRDSRANLIMPFVVFHREEPDDSFWDQDSGRDLYNAAVMTGVKMTQFDYFFKTASFKQIYAAGDKVEVPSKQLLDTLTVLQVKGENASVGTLDLQAHLNQLKDALVFQINSVINNYGISADQWSLAISEMSGRALKIRNRALLEYREDQLPLFRQYEEELFNTTRIVNNTWPGLFKKIPDKAEFSIDFGEIEFPEDPEDEIRIQTKKLRSGIISPGQFFQYFNPDIKDEKEAEKELMKNLDKLQKMREKYPQLEEALDYILGSWKSKEEPEEEEEEE